MDSKSSLRRGGRERIRFGVSDKSNGPGWSFVGEVVGCEFGERVDCEEREYCFEVREYVIGGGGDDGWVG